MLDFPGDNYSQVCGPCPKSRAIEPDGIWPNRRFKGTLNHLVGASAEDAVARAYERKGCVVIARRYRNQAGEVDLILKDGSTYVFVEVKSSRCFAAAAERITRKQIARVFSAAELFLGQTPEGPFAETRFDAGLVNGSGEVEIVESALWLH